MADKKSAAARKKHPAHRAEAKSMTRKAGGYDQARRIFGRIDHRQRVRRQIDEAAPSACNRRLSRDRKHPGHAIHDIGGGQLRGSCARWRRLSS